MAAGDLTTLAYVQGYTGDTSTASEAAFPALITAASKFVAHYCSREFYITSYTEAYNGTGNTRLLLRNQPVLSVSSVSILGTTIPLSGGVNAYGYLFDARGLWLRGAYWPKTVQGIVVAYSAGLAADAASMPEDLQQCVAIMVNIRRKRVAQEDKTSIGMEQQSTSFVASELTPLVRQILGQYRIPLVAGP